MRGGGDYKRIFGGAVVPPLDCLSFHDGRGFDSYRGGRITYRGGMFPRGRFPDGDVEFLPVHRDGEESDLLVVDPAIVVLDPFTVDFPEFLRHGRSLDEYARGGRHRDGCGGVDVEVAIKTSECVNKFVHNGRQVWEKNGSFVEEIA